MYIYLCCLFSIPTIHIVLKSIPCNDILKRKILCWSSGIILFLISALRSTDVGTDLENYLPFFTTISSLPLTDIFNIGWEPGYLIFNKIISVISSDSRFFLICTSLFIVVGYVTFIYKNSSYPWLSLFLFIALGTYTDSFNIIRQSMAIVIILHSLKFIEKDNLIKYFLYVILATLFHKTAIVCLIIPIIYHFKATIPNFFILLIISYISISLLGSSVLSLAIELAFNEYSLTGYPQGGVNMLILLIAITLISLFVLSDTKRYKLYCSMMILACCLQIFSLQFSLFARTVTYFSMAIIVLVPELVRRLHSPEIRSLSIAAIVAISSLYFVVFILKNNLSGIVPYHIL